jgi:hypothetical protein
MDGADDGNRTRIHSLGNASGPAVRPDRRGISDRQRPPIADARGTFGAQRASVFDFWRLSRRAVPHEAGQVFGAWHAALDLRLGSEQAGRLENAKLVAVRVSTDVPDPAALTQRLGCHLASSSLNNALKLDR